MFLDEAFIQVRAGSGGNGCVSFRREKYDPHGGPDGGDGGRGGDVTLRADSNLATLLDVSRRAQYHAGNGRKGTGANRSGKGGADLEIVLPVGTVVREVIAGLERRHGPVFGELLADGQVLVAARGGKGGKGNQHFATSTRQAPRFAAEPGKGEERGLYLELKLLADVGLVGLPNAGKSTLLARVSSATPKIADYPFTTLHPNLGIVELGDWKRLVVADIPGLIEGAHLGQGLGLEFLRHIERTRVLVHLVSVEPLVAAGVEDDESAAFAVLQRDYRCIEQELSHYSSELFQRERTVVLSKIDLVPAERRRAVEERCSRAIGRPVLSISAATGEGINDLVRALGRSVDQKLDSNIRAVPR